MLVQCHTSSFYLLEQINVMLSPDFEKSCSREVDVDGMLSILMQLLKCAGVILMSGLLVVNPMHAFSFSGSALRFLTNSKPSGVDCF
jgi:hypothetical protein